VLFISWFEIVFFVKDKIILYLRDRYLTNNNNIFNPPFNQNEMEDYILKLIN